MGAWGSGVFDNDAAADWALGLADGGYEYIRSTLAVAVEAGDFLDADEGAEALAAAEAVARLGGAGGVGSAYSEPVDGWVSAQAGNAPADLVALAARAVRAVLAESSELAELWDEAGVAEAAQWRRALEEILGRLGT